MKENFSFPSVEQKKEIYSNKEVQEREKAKVAKGLGPVFCISM